MKIGDKLRIKKDAFDLKDKNLNGKIAECIDINEYGYEFLCDGEEFIVTPEGLECFFEPVEFQPKHMKEIKVEHRPDYDLYKKGFIVEDETKHAKEIEVHHPSHYQLHKHECIEEMIAVFGIEAVKTFCKLNVWKYRYRHAGKNGEKDLHKADEYMDILMDLEER